MKQERILLKTVLLYVSVIIIVSACSNSFMASLLRDRNGPAPRVLTGIKIKVGSIKMEYRFADSLDIDGLVIIENWSNENIEQCYGTDFFDDDFEMNTDFEESIPGDYSVTITYKEKTDSIKVYIIPPEFYRYEFDDSNVRKIYERDEPLDLTGFKVTEIWEDNSNPVLVYGVNLDVNDINDISGYDNSIPGDQTVEVTYRGETTSFDVFVNDYPGTESNPLIITDASSLLNIGKNLNAHYRQGGDIDLSELLGTDDWTPIGTSGAPFTGSYDGGEHAIKNLVISTKGNFGLFGYIGSSGVVKNLGVTYVDISPGGNGVNDIGGLVVNNYGTIRNCFVTGTIISGNNKVGAIVGNNFSTGVVKNCYATVEVSGSTNIGGIVGVNNGGRVENCVALNPNIEATQNNPDYGRVVGSSSTPQPSNYARGDMKFNGSLPWVASKNNGVDGTSISDEEYNDPEWWKALFGDDWWEGRPLPVAPY